MIFSNCTFNSIYRVLWNYFSQSSFGRPWWTYLISERAIVFEHAVPADQEADPSGQIFQRGLVFRGIYLPTLSGGLQVSWVSQNPCLMNVNPVVLASIMGTHCRSEVINKAPTYIKFIILSLLNPHLTTEHGSLSWSNLKNNRLGKFKKIKALSINNLIYLSYSDKKQLEHSVYQRT